VGRAYTAWCASPIQIKLLISDALDSALATRNEPEYQPDEPVDGRAKASPAGTTWAKVAKALEEDDIAQKETMRLGRGAEKRKAKQLTEPRLARHRVAGSILD
jgi:hypothetical protein